MLFRSRALSKLGAAKGGRARAARLSEEERRAIASNAARTRWADQRPTPDGVLVASFGAPDRPLKLGDAEIPCYVIERPDGEEPMRVLVMTGMLKALNMSLGGSSGRVSGNRLYRFVASQAIRPFVSDALVDKLNSPLVVRPPVGSDAYGYEGTTLADICDAVLEARRAGQLNRQQRHIAEQCEVLVRGWARVGLAAMIDEVTGFQYYRSRRALEKILDNFLRDERGKWAKTFPDDFYAEVFRLRGWRYVPLSVSRPQVLGHVTNDIVYERLAPGVLDELRRRVPRDDQGRRKHRFHQWLTDDVGHPKLREHLASVTTLMRASDNWRQFYRMLDKSLPSLNTTLPLPIPETDLLDEDQPQPN